MSDGSVLADHGPSPADTKQYGQKLIASSLMMEMLPEAVTHGSIAAAVGGSIPPVSSLLLLPELDDSSRNGTSWWTDIPYPGSGYTQIGIILLAFFITCIMILIVVGNLLVCIAISTEKSLKTVQNWFIASLAVSDLLLGCVIMPFSLAYELMGYWIFGQVWCEVHHALDVFFCTASINNLCLISLDRYWSVTQAVEYLKKRTPARAMFMIGFVWVFSALVCLPPLLGWKGRQVEGQCYLSEDLGYVLYSANGSFFVPAIVMVFVYARIFVAARTRARRNIKKKKLPIAPSEVTADPAKDKSTTTCTSLSNPSPPDRTRSDDDDDSVSPKAAVVSVISAPTPRLPSILVPPAHHHPLHQSQQLSPDTPSTMSPAALMAPEIIVEATPTPHSSPSKACDRKSADDKCKVSFQTPLTPEHGSRHRSRVNNNSEETRFGSEEIAESTSTGSPALSNKNGSRLLAPAPLSRCRGSPYGSSLSIADYEDSDLCTEPESSETRTRTAEQATLAPAARMVQTEAERHKRKVAKARERRATFILGLIMASFIGAWLPFFTMYLIQGICKKCTIAPALFTTAFWMGYCNSAINPIIYTVFNRDFRRSFRKILFR